MNKKLICPVCNGKAEIRFVPYTFERFGQKFLYQNIKATVCLKCGEQFLDGPTVTNIEREIRESVFEKVA
jgi:YgiT-type zinc finger domain-containing protein